MEADPFGAHVRAETPPGPPPESLFDDDPEDTTAFALDAQHTDNPAPLHAAARQHLVRAVNLFAKRRTVGTLTDAADTRTVPAMAADAAAARRQAEASDVASTELRERVRVLEAERDVLQGQLVSRTQAVEGLRSTIWRDLMMLKARLDNVQGQPLSVERDSDRTYLDVFALLMGDTPEREDAATIAKRIDDAVAVERLKMRTLHVAKAQRLEGEIARLRQALDEAHSFRLRTEQEFADVRAECRKQASHTLGELETAHELQLRETEALYEAKLEDQDATIADLRLRVRDQEGDELPAHFAAIKSRLEAELAAAKNDVGILKAAASVRETDLRIACSAVTVAERQTREARAEAEATAEEAEQLRTELEALRAGVDSNVAAAKKAILAAAAEEKAVVVDQLRLLRVSADAAQVRAAARIAGLEDELAQAHDDTLAAGKAADARLADIANLEQAAGTAVSGEDAALSQARGLQAQLDDVQRALGVATVAQASNESRWADVTEMVGLVAGRHLRDASQRLRWLTDNALFGDQDIQERATRARRAAFHSLGEAGAVLALATSTKRKVGGETAAGAARFTVDAPCGKWPHDIRALPPLPASSDDDSDREEVLSASTMAPSSEDSMLPGIKRVASQVSMTSSVASFSDDDVFRGLVTRTEGRARRGLRAFLRDLAPLAVAGEFSVMRTRKRSAGNLRRARSVLRGQSVSAAGPGGSPNKRGSVFAVESFSPAGVAALVTPARRAVRHAPGGLARRQSTLAKMKQLRTPTTASSPKGEPTAREGKRGVRMEKLTPPTSIVAAESPQRTPSMAGLTPPPRSPPGSPTRSPSRSPQASSRSSPQRTPPRRTVPVASAALEHGTPPGLPRVRRGGGSPRVSVSQPSRPGAVVPPPPGLETPPARSVSPPRSPPVSLPRYARRTETQSRVRVSGTDRGVQAAVTTVDQSTGTARNPTTVSASAAEVISVGVGDTAIPGAVNDAASMAAPSSLLFRLDSAACDIDAATAATATPTEARWSDSAHPVQGVELWAKLRERRDRLSVALAALTAAITGTAEGEPMSDSPLPARTLSPEPERRLRKPRPRTFVRSLRSVVKRPQDRPQSPADASPAEGHNSVPTTPKATVPPTVASAASPSRSMVRSPRHPKAVKLLEQAVFNYVSTQPPAHPTPLQLSELSLRGVASDRAPGLRPTSPPRLAVVSVGDALPAAAAPTVVLTALAGHRPASAPLSRSPDRAGQPHIEAPAAASPATAAFRGARPRSATKPKPSVQRTVHREPAEQPAVHRPRTAHPVRPDVRYGRSVFQAAVRPAATRDITNVLGTRVE